jgi:hypothetical protein
MNPKISIVLFALILMVSFAWQTRADELKLAQGHLTAAGKALPNHTLLLEGKRLLPWYAFFARAQKADEVKTLATTDEKGFFQIVDLPAGEYTLKLMRAGDEPVPLKMFTLARDYKLADVSAKVTVSGIATDGVLVFTTGIDANGRKVTRQATSTSVGLLDDGTTWTLRPEQKE